MRWFVKSRLEALPVLRRKYVASWLLFYNASHSLALCISWTWSCRKWSQCSPLATQEGGGLHHLTVSLNVLQEVSMGWNILSMWSSYIGRGRALCMLQLPGTINHSCFWLLLCSQIVPPSLSKGRLDIRMTSNGFKWGCAQAIQSLSVSGVELATTKVYWLLLPLTCILTSRGKDSISFGSMFRQFALTLLGYLSSWLVLTAVLHWTGADLLYGEVHHLQGSESDLRHSMVFQNIYHIGDTKSAQELEVFLRMSRERLRLCCGIQCTDSLHPNGPRQRQKLFTAALKLLWFAIGIETVRCENEAQRALHAALLPLLRLEDGHVLATLSAIVLALCEGRTGLAISGVFEAGKTRSAAALLAGLLVFDPSLQLMVLTKENIAAHAVAEHLVSLQMPDYLQDKMGRLVGYYEQNRKGSYTPLDILPSNRNQVIRQKSLLIGCGGGFQQECSQQFSPVADWMGSVDLFLEDEGQQYGNMEEAASVARTPATCLEVWSGDHRQTPGGLKKSKESKAFRKKLTKRPLALRCQTQYIQAHDLGDIALRYLDCPKDSFAWTPRRRLHCHRSCSCAVLAWAHRRLTPMFF